ncbi:rhomboid family intramembrane serine protease [Tabrizicola oligotrophica]|uniref:Rhomboid family intramembrane serine protease n=1 Tax=Tabrizicola oligotrophica TaxID=2710650 RepID=A0A6M0QUM4_9RHOB|nr:rhomboid family intramembrane serine protease [Tabrizicola oligotrophica]NEY90701.1 rhomboid family intramembrane serine protease [Tabrizicola oligotrophica]
MFPIRDHNPSGRTPYVTFALIALNAVVFLGYWTSLSDFQIDRLFMTWGLVPQSLMRGEGLASIVTSMFLHAGWMHILGNMLFLWIFGDNLEDEMGHGGFLLFYLLAGLAAALAQVAMDPLSTIPMVGASGAIAGVMGGYLLLFPKARVDVLFIFIIFFRIFAIPAWIVLGVWFALQLFSGLSVPGDMGGVAYWAHAGGFAGGLILGLPAFLRRGGRSYWARTAGHPPHPQAAYPLSRSNIPRVPRR